MTNQPKFDFYEKVQIVSPRQSKQEVWREIGAVLGKAQNDAGEWSYAVHVYRDRICWRMNEDELEAVGEFDKREMFYGD